MLSTVLNLRERLPDLRRDEFFRASRSLESDLIAIFPATLCCGIAGVTTNVRTRTIATPISGSTKNRATGDQNFVMDEYY